jgi:hypothetical protein
MTTDKIKITMSERRPMSVSKAEWPSIAYGESFAGQYDFQSFDGAKIRVRRHADGRAIVYGYAGDWAGGGRPTRENREAGFLVESTESGDALVRAIRRVAGILSETECVGQLAHAAARRCIADLPEEEAGAPPSQVESDVDRALRTIDTIAVSGGTGIDPGYAKDLASAVAAIRKALTK